MKVCTRCKFLKPIDKFYKSKTHSQGVMCYCKSCFNQKAVHRWIERKRKAITFKGNQCADCGLHLNNSHYSVFEFHHIAPSEKDHDWTKPHRRSDSSKIMGINSARTKQVYFTVC